MRKINLFGTEIIFGKDAEKEVKQHLRTEVMADVREEIRESVVETVREELREEVLVEVKEDVIVEYQKAELANRNKEVIETVSFGDGGASTSFGAVESISEAVTHRSPNDIRKMLDSTDIDMRNLLEALRQDYSDEEIFKENEQMAKDPIVGSAMEMMADDCSQINPTTHKIVTISAEDAKLQKFLNDFLTNNVKVESRFWEWAYEVIKHGDLKLRRREYSANGKAKNVYYENVTEGFKVSRIEYLGQILGYLDGEEGDSKKLEAPEQFVHFMSGKLPRRKKVRVKLTTKGADGMNKKEDVTCYKVGGSSLVDNARYIYRVVNLLDDMLIMSRVARSSQFNLVKVEVGQSSPIQTQRILQDVKRRVEGNTRLKQAGGIKSDPSPIPINSNVYIPLREGKGDVLIESVGDAVDVKAIVDIDYFRNKEFATLKVPKAYMGFEESLPGTNGNASLTKMDIRYARTVTRGWNTLKEGIIELCNNYLKYRGRNKDVGKFDVVLKPITSVEDSSMIEDFIMRMGIFTDLGTMVETYDAFIDKGKLFLHVMNLIGFDVSQIASDELKTIIKGIKDDKDVDGEKNTKEFDPLMGMGGDEPAGDEEGTGDEEDIENEGGMIRG